MEPGSPTHSTARMEPISPTQATGATTGLPIHRIKIHPTCERTTVVLEQLASQLQQQTTIIPDQIRIHPRSTTTSPTPQPDIASPSVASSPTSPSSTTILRSVPPVIVIHRQPPATQHFDFPLSGLASPSLQQDQHLQIDDTDSSAPPSSANGATPAGTVSTVVSAGSSELDTGNRSSSSSSAPSSSSEQRQRQQPKQQQPKPEVIHEPSPSPPATTPSHHHSSPRRSSEKYPAKTGRYTNMHWNTRQRVIPPLPISSDDHIGMPPPPPQDLIFTSFKQSQSQYSSYMNSPGSFPHMSHSMPSVVSSYLDDTTTSEHKVPQSPAAAFRKKQPYVPLGKRVLRAFLSLRFAFFLMSVITLTLVSVLAWTITLQAAQSTISTVNSDYSTVLISQISTDISHRLAAAEHVTKLNSDYWANGIITTPTSMYNMFLIQLRDLGVDTITGLSMTTSSGDVSGFNYYYPTRAAPFMVRWDTPTPKHLVETLVLNPNTGVGTNITYQSYYNDGTIKAPYLCVDITDSTSYGWTDLYLMNSRQWTFSTSHTVMDSSGAFVGVVSAHLPLTFTDSIPKQITSATVVGTEFVILNVKTGTIIGTSLTNFSLIDSSTDPSALAGVYLFNGPLMLQAIHQFILGETGRSPDANTSPDTLYTGITNTLQGEYSSNGLRLTITVEPFDHGSSANPSHQIHWLLIHVIDRSVIQSNLNESNSRVLSSVLCIGAAFIFASSMLLWYSMRLIGKLSQVLTSFSRFEFRDTMKSDELKRRSIFTELCDIQEAVCEMTRSFKKHLDGKYLNGLVHKSSHYTMEIDSRIPSQTPRLQFGISPALEVEMAAAAALAASHRDFLKHQAELAAQQQPPTIHEMSSEPESKSNLVHISVVQPTTALQPTAV